MDISLLEQVGLTKSEISVYLALLELGSSSTGKIIDKAKVSSSKIYEILDRLMRKGLVSLVTKDNVKHFDAAPPSRLLDYMTEQEEELKAKKSQLKDLLPELELKRTLANNVSNARIYKGPKGVQTAFYEALDLLGDGDDMLVMGIPSRTKEQNIFFLKYAKARAKKKVVMKAIFNEEARGEPMTLLKNDAFMELKFLPESTPAAVNVFNDRVLIFPKTESGEEIIIAIDNKQTAESFRAQFYRLWSQNITTITGFDAVTKKFEKELDYMNEGEEYYVLGASLESGNKKITDWLDKYHKLRIQKKRNVKFLTQYDVYDNILNRAKSSGDKKLKITQVRRLAPDFNTPFQINLYGGNKVWFVLWGKGVQCIEIISKEVYNNFKTFFDALWNQDSYVLKGLDAVQGLFDEMLEQGGIDIIGARGYFMDHRPDYIKEWVKKAKQMNFTMRNIVDEEIRGAYITTLPFVQTKYSLQKEFAELSVFWIMKDKVAIGNWVDDEPTILIIENPEIVGVYKKQFEMLWNAQ